MGAGSVIGAIATPIAGHFAQKRQHKYVKKYMKNKWQWEVADLKAAGLNPILGIAGSSPNIGGAGGLPNMSVGSPDIVGAYKEIKSAKAKLAIIQSEREMAGNAASRSFFDANKSMFDARSAESDSIINAARLPAAQAQERMDRTDFGAWVRYLNRAVRGVTGRAERP